MTATRDDLLDLFDAVCDAAFFAQARLGTRASGRAYADALAEELRLRRVRHRRRVAFPVTYEGLTFERAFEVDFVVGGRLVVLARERGRPLDDHAAHLDTYVRHSGLAGGVVFDFGRDPLEEGVRTVWRVEPSLRDAPTGVDA